MKLVIEVHADNGITRMEFELVEVEGLRIRAKEDETPGWWSMLLQGETVNLVITDAKVRREP